MIPNICKEIRAVWQSMVNRKSAAALIVLGGQGLIAEIWMDTKRDDPRPASASRAAAESPV